MSYWSHNPELYDEIIMRELRWRADNAPGECVICFDWLIAEETSLEVNADWIEKKFGVDFFMSLTGPAEADHWGGLADDAMMRMKEARLCL
jgi:hypothetical protein